MKRTRKVLELLRCENCGQLFIGGNRKRETNDGSVSLTLNFPNLEQIPNFNPTPMVQNKTYQDYAIFWPKDLNTPINIPEGSANQGGGDHVVVISTGECAYSNGKAQWVPGYLDSLTGKFTPKEQSLAANTGSLKASIKTNGIQGFLYRVVNNNNGAEISYNGTFEYLGIYFGSFATQEDNSITYYKLNDNITSMNIRLRII